EGGGPHLDLLRRTSHWLMKQPDLDEEALRLQVHGKDLVVQRQTMADTVAPVTVTSPSGATRELTLTAGDAGIWSSTFPASELGLWQATDGTLKALINVGPTNPKEFSEVTSTTDMLKPLAQATGGDAQRVADVSGVELPRIVPVRSSGIFHGDGWMGVRMRDASVVKGVGVLPVFAGLIGLLLLLGACGKSAQVPLQSWLGDAMEGPTPVSALIHAATMVTAGVYLIARSNFIFDVSPNARLAVAIVGTVTLVFGAIIGCAKDDIKKALAASTMSQIGYMMLAVGLGPAGYAFGIAHLLTHGFFKAGLFLGAGSVMHGMNDEVDMRRYGGLRKFMPFTFITFGLGYLAIIGFPGLAGWFTKDAIIEAAFHKGGTSGAIFGGCALAAAGLTAFYMTRVMLMTFFGEPRWADDAHPHESPNVMTVPMWILAIGSVGGGYVLILSGRLAKFLAVVVPRPADIAFKPIGVIGLATAGVVLLGVVGSWLMYGRRPVPAVAPVGSPLTIAARRDLLGDALNESVFMRPGQYLTRLLVYFDNRGIDGFVNGFAAFVGGTSSRVRRFQSGFVRSYALSMFGGIVLVLAALLLVKG
ncbi:MAG TPA: NADH-quinone oxidoreductase subunit L, partial [Acidothermaceae bacterium]